MRIRASRLCGPAKTGLYVIATLVAVSIGLVQGAAPGDGGDAATLHVLNRIGFGARPVDVARVRKLGVTRYIDEQLHPDRIDDGSVAGRLASFQTLELNGRTLAE